MSAKSRPMWTTFEGIVLCQSIERIVTPLGYHCALGGSVLTKGSSEKDLDIFVYPHKTREGDQPAEIRSALESQLRISDWDKKEHTAYGDDKEVYATQWEGKRIDFFFVR